MIDAITVAGPPEARGRAQAAARPDGAGLLREVVARRLAPLRDRIASGEAAAYLARQRAFAEAQCGVELAETAGIAAGYGLAEADLFAYLHAAILAGDAPLAAAPVGGGGGSAVDGWAVDGCTCLVAPCAAGGAVIAKNRDLSADLLPLQAVFRRVADPARPGRVVVALGSLGAPGAYSSGINEAGLALADTAIAAPAYGVGWLRYFLMTRLLERCDSVAAALAFIRSVPHAGGGSLALADASGATAMVELGPAHLGGPVILEGGPRGRSNHFLAPALARPPTSKTSPGRLATAEAALAAGFGDWTTARIHQLMASHDGPDGTTGLCRHGDGEGASTLSAAIYRTRSPSLAVTLGPPCATPLADFRPVLDCA
jgi:hypothetical protein